MSARSIACFALCALWAGGCDQTPIAADGAAGDGRDLAAPPDLATRHDLTMPPPFCTDGADGGPPATRASVERLLAATCALLGCHGADSSTAEGHLDLRAGHVQAALVNVPSTAKCGGIRVVPGDPASSYLMHKLVDATPCDGLGMPRCEDGVCPLKPCEVDVVRRWIAGGAQP